MAGDIAEIGFRAQTADLDKAKAKLVALKPAAKQAETASEQLSGALDRQAGAAARGAAANTKLAASEDAAAGGARRHAVALGAANDNSRRMGGSFSGLAAQFQDIGVTAAMGMNPMIVALQQGTQIAGQMEAAMASGASAASVLGTAFKSLFSPLTFITIGLTALAVAGLQMVDWANVAKTALEYVATGIEVIGPYAVVAAAALALIYAPAIISGIWTLLKSVYLLETAMVAMYSVIGWPVLLVAGIVALGAVAVAFRDDLTRFLGVDIVGAAKAGANFLLNSFYGAFENIKFLWSQFPTMIEAALTGAKNFFTGGTENAAAELLAQANKQRQTNLNNIMNTDRVAEWGKALGDGASYAASKVEQLAGSMTGVDKKAAKKAEKDAAKFDDIIDGANAAIASSEAEAQAIGLSEFAAAKLRHETELLNQAKQKDLDLTTAQRAQLTGLAVDMATAEVATKKAKEAFDFAKDVVKGFVADLRDGLKQGESFWDALGNAAMNVLDKITDKLLNDVVDALFEVGEAGSSAGGGGGGIFGFFAGLFKSAKGNAFTRTDRFAKGGDFTNSVVTRPTLFKFANGGALGEMGEAGPEAILPLKRGNDGSLGVQMVSGGGASNDNTQRPAVYVEVIVNGQGTVTQETERRSDGSELRRFIIDTVNSANANGEFDSTNQGRYSQKPKKVVR